MKRRFKIHIPIAMKLVAMTTCLLLLATIPIALRTSSYFENAAATKEKADNLEQAQARAEEIDSLLSSYVDKTRIIASLLLKSTASEDLDVSFFEDKDLVSVEVWTLEGSSPKVDKRVVRETYLSERGLSADYVSMIRKARRFPVNSVFAGNVEIKNSSSKSGVPLLTIGVPFVKDDFGRITHVAIADLKLDRIQRVFASSGVRLMYLLDDDGAVIAHPDDALAMDAVDLSETQSFKTASAATVTAGQSPFRDAKTGERYFGAFARTRFGAIVFSQSLESIILEPGREARREAFFITGLVFSAALFLVFIFSITLTVPIEKLLDLTREIAKGNFDVHAQSQVRSHDEVGELAQSFDVMTEGLKERDKVKTMFSKFHGSSVAEDILKGDTASLRGTSRDVTVFFSDIRDFTKFSEGHTPEEVVEMLNEYFEIMVGIINRSGGVVDKFIGDAIMAVWGAPTSSGRDAENAVRACLDMRRALGELNERRTARGQVPIRIGMGLHSGRAISGTIGSTERMEYTVIGDTVNMAARIEASTKALGTDLLVSELTSQQVQERFILDLGGTVEVKGKSEPLTLFKVKGYFGDNNLPVLVSTPYSDYEASGDDKVKVA